MRVKKNDLVKVITGKLKGTVSKVTFVDVKGNRVFLEDGPKVKRNLKPERSKKHPEGGIIEKQASIHISNVMPMLESASRPVRVGYKFENGKKIRVAKGSQCNQEVI